MQKVSIPALFIACWAMLSCSQSANTIVTPNGPASSTVVSTSVATGTYTDLWIPPSLTGTTFNLTLGKSTKQMQPGAVTSTYGYNGASFWGPTLIMNKGDFVKMNVTNNLSEATTTHWHGFHIPAIMDGGPHQMIEAGTT